MIKIQEMQSQQQSRVQDNDDFLQMHELQYFLHLQCCGGANGRSDVHLGTHALVSESALHP